MRVLFSASDLYVQPIVTCLIQLQSLCQEMGKHYEVTESVVSSSLVTSYLDSGPASSHSWSVA